MNLTIKRLQDKKNYDESFHISSTSAVTLLAALYDIKSKLDPTLTFAAGCKSGICGSCAVLVNGKEQLACSYKYQDGDLIEPLRYHPALRDLKVYKSKAHDTLKQTLSSNTYRGLVIHDASVTHHESPDPKTLRHPELAPKGISCGHSGSTAPTTNQANEHHTSSQIQNRTQTPQDEAKAKIQTDCILCDSCYSSCPVLAVNPDFIGPFALTKAWRYIVGEKPDEAKWQTHGSAHTILENIQSNGIWDCTLCGECTIACPQGIDPKTDIMMLRGEAGKAGYMDPDFSGMDFGASSFGTPDFGGGF